MNSTPTQRESRAAFAAVFAAANKRNVRIGDTLHTIVGTAEEFDAMNKTADDMIARALKRGETVTEDGVARWVTEAEVINPGQSGSAAFVWKGDKVKVARTLVTKHSDGRIEQAPAGFAWRSL